MINRYLQTRYVKYGRGPVDVDCYGLVRLARHELFGRAMLPSYSEIDPDDKQALTAATLLVREEGCFLPCTAQLGAIATAWRARLCVHVGLVVHADGRLWVLETNEGKGPCLTSIWDFEPRYTQVIYYDDTTLS
ncbi:hypothetical protein [Pusillimonas sp. ANT_WB101]|uniref:hypothetical protein n=1 Tax=Pusillimonas sp. ANT_WB101 TaxID=2597356 RepID=UPI0011EDAEA0|nr:hypothetical protein [Pusillimonas sp. ANT_WB101]KAA0910690.1 hypothetical protein FQ179_02095 [Pusillimonas sp. ANT_WB101]